MNFHEDFVFNNEKHTNLEIWRPELRTGKSKKWRETELNRFAHYYMGDLFQGSFGLLVLKQLHGKRVESQKHLSDKT